MKNTSKSLMSKVKPNIIKSLTALAVTTTLALSTVVHKVQAQEENSSIALIISTLNNPFFVSMKEGAEAKADELGYELVVLDSQNDPGKELANVEDVLVKGVGAILINPTDSDAVVNAVRIANNKKVPVLTLDRGASAGEIASHIASDNVAGGEMAADFIAEQVGENAKVIQLEGIAGTSAARERGEGFNNGAKKHGFDILATQPADFDRTKGLNVMENLLTAKPDVQAVFAQNDEMALGALRAIQAANKDVVLVGFDGTDDGVAAVKQGVLSATIAQQPALIGELGVESVSKLLNGESVDSAVSVPLKVIAN